MYTSHHYTNDTDAIKSKAEINIQNDMQTQIMFLHENRTLALMNCQVNTVWPFTRATSRNENKIDTDAYYCTILTPRQLRCLLQSEPRRS